MATEVTLAWDAASGADTYDVFLGDINSPPADWQDPAELITVGNTANTQQLVDFTALDASDYWFGVRSVAGSGTDARYSQIAWTRDETVVQDRTFYFDWEGVDGNVMYQWPSSMLPRFVYGEAS
jgi:hypothetical protein